MAAILSIQTEWSMSPINMASVTTWMLMFLNGCTCFLKSKAEGY